MPNNEPIEPQTSTPPTHPLGTHETAVEPSGVRGDNPATAGPGPTEVRSDTPENASGRRDPSSAEDVNTTPGTAADK